MASNNNTSLHTAEASPSIWSQYLGSYIPYLILGSWSTTANLFIIIALAKDKSLREKHQLVIALATGDAFISLAILTSGIARLLLLSEGAQDQLVSHKECFLRPWNSFFMIGYQFSALVTVLISLERLACVSAPIKYYQLPSKLYLKIAIIISAACVIISLLVGFLLSYKLPNCISNICLTSDTFTSSYALYNYTVCAISGLINVVIYILSVVAMRVSMTRIGSNNKAKSRLIAQSKVTKVMAVVLSSQFSLVALPNLAKMTAIIAQVDSSALTAFWPYLSHAAVANSSLTIIIYIIFNSELRSAFKAVFGAKTQTFFNSSVTPRPKVVSTV